MSEIISTSIQCFMHENAVIFGAHFYFVCAHVFTSLDKNQLNGTIPTEMGSLTSLETMSVYASEFVNSNVETSRIRNVQYKHFKNVAFS